MLAADSLFLMGWNWYDWFVAVGLLYGVWSGLRNGFIGELIWMLGAILMVVCGVNFYQAGGEWLSGLVQVSRETSNLIAFVGISLAVYAVALAVRQVLHKRMKKSSVLSASIENLGGVIGGVVRMTAIMALVTITLCLTRSTFWHKQVGRDSRFGSYIVNTFPSVAEMVNRTFSEKMWFLEDIPRPEDPGTPADTDIVD